MPDRDEDAMNYMITQSPFLAASSVAMAGLSSRRYTPGVPSTPPTPPRPAPEFLKLLLLRDDDVRDGEFANGRLIGPEATEEFPRVAAFCE